MKNLNDIEKEAHYLLRSHAEKFRKDYVYVSGEQHIVDYLVENLHISDKTATSAVKNLFSYGYIYFDEHCKEMLHILKYPKEKTIYSPRPQYVLDTNLLSDSTLHVSTKDWVIWSYCMNFAKNKKFVFISYSAIAKAIGSKDITANSVKRSLDRLSNIMEYKIAKGMTKKCEKAMEKWSCKKEEKDNEVMMFGILLEKHFPTKEELRDKIESLLDSEKLKTLAERLGKDIDDPENKKVRNRLRKRVVRRIKFISYSLYSKIKEMQVKEKKFRKKISWRTTLRQYVRLACKNIQELKRRREVLKSFDEVEVVVEDLDTKRNRVLNQYLKEKKIRLSEIKWFFGAPPLLSELYGFEYYSGIAIDDDGNVI